MQRVAAWFLLLLSPLVSLGSASSVGMDPTVVEDGISKDFISPAPSLRTETQFDEELEVTSEEIPYRTEYIDDGGMEVREEIVEQEGQLGEVTRTYLAIYWEGEETGRELLSAERTEPVTKIVRRGTKIVWRTLTGTDCGRLSYWRKLTVWATSYDGNCRGCRGLTYSGTPVRRGVCAVDPDIIPLGINFYVPGYGICRSEDIGGAVKGRSVDLGFEDVTQGDWSARYTDVYLLTRP